VVANTAHLEVRRNTFASNMRSQTRLTGREYVTPGLLSSASSYVTLTNRSVNLCL
jgi:hypothetical protein